MENFRRVSAEEADSLLEALHETGSTVLLKFPDSGVLRLKTELAPRPMDAILGVRPATLGEARRGQLATGNFSLGRQFFFFSAKVDVQKKHVILEIVDGLHRLVRVRSGRLKLPANMAVNLVTQRLGSKTLILHGPLQDVSEKGCKVALHAEGLSLSPGDRVSGALRFGARLPLKVSGTVRYHRRLSRGHYNQILGVEFLELEDDERFQKWLIDLQREVYARQRGTF